ncbi:TlpA family protein disulfide reductase [Paenibacillus lignilyticus]|uniref:TlpA family protein disulfide reductase n=1 Tax=Paenibacillus lignilyticus TaxID=1172615 RepID=A0ABS5C5Q2_9BACL|nr:TlpA disulfide reductase family protein [Paenibacillus lignilyticus]MBP3961334.1 TlpA family protein disulfide reductase [Paenibacillus lignilyticus]
MKRSIVLIVIVLVLAGAAVYQNKGKHNEALAASGDMLPKPGYTAPTLELPNLTDQVTAIGGKREKLLMVNFWASWCWPCEMEAPDMQALSEKYGDKLELYGINATSLDKERQAREFVTEQKLKFPILMDRDGKATDLYKVNTFPTTLLIDSNGIVRERIGGVISKSKWEAIIDKWIDVQEEQHTGT